MYTKDSDESIGLVVFFSLLVSDTKILGVGALSEIQVYVYLYCMICCCYSPYKVWLPCGVMSSEQGNTGNASQSRMTITFSFTRLY